MEIASFLHAKKVKMIVVACNTASAYALTALRRAFSIPIIGVIEPGAITALEYSYSGRIGIIGTQGTIKSLSYPASIKKKDPNARVFSQACPLFVPLVEEGWVDHVVTHEVAKVYLAPLMKNKIDTLVLGCTHYPLIKRVIKKITGPGIKLVDSAEATAKSVLMTLHQKGMLNTQKRSPSYRFYVSDIPQKFQEIGQRCLGRSVSPVRKITLEKK
jgi:glutamate racemase